MTITAIDPQVKDPNRCNLSVDGQFCLGLQIDIIWEYKLKVGQPIDQATIEKLRQADNLIRAYHKALGYLATRPRSKREVYQYLQQKLIYRHPDWPQIPSEDQADFIQKQQANIEDIMQKLIQAGYLDDAAFAQWWIDNRRNFRPRGKRLLLAELKAKGISDQDIQTALTTPSSSGHFTDTHQSTPQHYDETADALKLLQKYLKKYTHLPTIEQKQKAYRHLASKGYDYDTIEAAWQQFVAEEG